MTWDTAAIILLGLLVVPFSWLLPRAIIFDAIAAYSVLVIAWFSPATAIWLLASTALIYAAMRLGDAFQLKGICAALAATAVLVGFVFSEFESGFVWIGVSFFTLRLLHVLCDWWIGKLAAQSLRALLHYQFFLPVMLVGPVNRFQNFQRQITRRRFDWSDLLAGLERCLIGAFMAHFLGEVVVGRGYDQIAEILGNQASFFGEWALSAIGWVKLYFVFAGLSAIALGTSQAIGLRLEENFNQPWRAASLLDFWSRWHISLTTWCRDYAYRPVMAITRSPVSGVIAAMLVIGLWHAISPYYMLWSFWQALGIIVSRFAGRFVPIAGLPVGVRAVIVSLLILGWLALARPVIFVVLGVSNDAAISPF